MILSVKYLKDSGFLLIYDEGNKSTEGDKVYMVCLVVAKKITCLVIS